jgi:hypothetical protein
MVMVFDTVFAIMVSWLFKNTGYYIINQAPGARRPAFKTD